MSTRTGLILSLICTFFIFILLRLNRTPSPFYDHLLTMPVDNDKLCSQYKDGIPKHIDIPTQPPPFEEIWSTLSGVSSLKTGGFYSPKDCKPRERIAIVVPYRERELQLRTFLHVMHQHLQQQNAEYQIVLATPQSGETFNRGKLLNIGFSEARKLGNFSCFIFHDVDLLPLDIRNIYGCHENPRHMSVIIDSLNNHLPYPEIFGGAGAITEKQMVEMNGYSNSYWGWGGEDDDMSCRISFAGYTISRADNRVTKYHMPKVEHESTNQNNHCRFKLLNNVQYRHKTEGLNTLNYTVVKKHLHPLFVQIFVDQHEKEETTLLDEQGFLHCPPSRGRKSRSCYHENEIY